MRLRRLVSFLAVLGVLLHAGALMRHNGVMLQALLQHQSLLTNLHQICGASGVESAGDADLPNVPPPTDAQKGCPICSGLAPLCAIASPQLVVLGHVAETIVSRPVAAFVVLLPADRPRPPTRAPPALA